MSIAALRKQYHRNICQQVLRLNDDGIPNIADISNQASKAISLRILEQFESVVEVATIAGQSKGTLFEQITKEFLQNAFLLLNHLRPGEWTFEIGDSISQFEQYSHLAYLQQVLNQNAQLASALGGDYLVTPDIVVARFPVSDRQINQFAEVVDPSISQYSPFRAANRPEITPLLHASISCKWTIRSDRSQNVRTEALNLIRNRKGYTPRIVVVTAEPLPTRLASLALGTGDLDCVYHFALPELRHAVENVSEDQLEMLTVMLEGNRLRDISDLPLDLAI